MSVLIRRVGILYVRPLLCLQSLFIAWLGWAGFLGRGPDTIMLTFLIMALIATIFAAAGARSGAAAEFWNPAGTFTHHFSGTSAADSVPAALSSSWSQPACSMRAHARDTDPVRIP
jgi:hypothetical protein